MCLAGAVALVGDVDGDVSATSLKPQDSFAYATRWVPCRKAFLQVSSQCTDSFKQRHAQLVTQLSASLARPPAIILEMQTLLFRAGLLRVFRFVIYLSQTSPSPSQEVVTSVMCDDSAAAASVGTAGSSASAATTTATPSVVAGDASATTVGTIEGTAPAVAAPASEGTPPEADALASPVQQPDSGSPKTSADAMIMCTGMVMGAVELGLDLLMDAVPLAEYGTVLKSRVDFISCLQALVPKFQSVLAPPAAAAGKSLRIDLDCSTTSAFAAACVEHPPMFGDTSQDAPFNIVYTSFRQVGNNATSFTIVPWVCPSKRKDPKLRWVWQ